MISYEEVCQALDRFNARRRNEAEMAQLEQTTDQVMQEMQEMQASPMADDMGEDGIIASDVLEETMEGGFTQQPPEDTHEIDVDDVVEEDLPEETSDKTRGDTD